MDKNFLPDTLAFDAFHDEDDILEFISSLPQATRRVIFDSLDKSIGEDIVLYARNEGEPEVHLVIMKFIEPDGGLSMLLSRNEANIYSYFERLKEENPKHSNFINQKLNIVHEHMKTSKLKI